MKTLLPMFAKVRAIKKEGLKMGTLVLLRHGESEWNKQNLFTGWVDIPLSLGGIQEAEKAGKELASLSFDVIFTSALIRAHMTLCYVMLHSESKKVPIFLHRDKKMKDWGQIYGEKSFENTVPVISSWHLNERCYGKLQGLNKQETKKQYGEEQVQLWRRGYAVSPPDGESLEMTAKRTLPFFKQKVVPFLEKGSNVLISAHGNSLRSIVMKLDGLTKEEVVELEIPTGVPLLYHYKDGQIVRKKK